MHWCPSGALMGSRDREKHFYFTLVSPRTYSFSFSTKPWLQKNYAPPKKYEKYRNNFPFPLNQKNRWLGELLHKGVVDVHNSDTRYCKTEGKCLLNLHEEDLGCERSNKVSVCQSADMVWIITWLCVLTQTQTRSRKEYMKCYAFFFFFLSPKIIGAGYL